MSRQFNYGVYGVGRIGKVHAAIVQEQGHRIVAIGDDNQEAVVAAQKELDVSSIQTFNGPADMNRNMADEIDAMIIAFIWKSH